MDTSKESVILEQYQQRMGQIQSMSDTVAIANLQLSKVLQKLGWSKRNHLNESVCLTDCPIDRSHKVKEAIVSEHLNICNLRKHNIKSVTKKELNPNPLFAYETSVRVVPVFIGERQYHEIGCRNFDAVLGEQNSICSVNSLLELDCNINEYKPCNPLDELRFIYSWSRIPKSYFVLRKHELPVHLVKNWINENHSVSADLMNSLTAWVYDSPTADTILNCLKGLDGIDGKSFVLKLWKFITAKSLCLQQQIPEHTRNEFEFYAAAVAPSDNVSADSKTKHEELRRKNNLPFLPMEWTRFNLTRDNKLKIYEYVVKIGKFLAKPSFQFDELAAEAEQQMKVLSALNADSKEGKTHLEIMAEMRDYKRRRQSYRGKNKANLKMSAIEVLREVVEQQMLYLNILNKNKHDSTLSETTPEVAGSSNDASVKLNRSGSTSLEQLHQQEHKGDKERGSVDENRRKNSRTRDNSRNNRHRSRSRDRHRSKSRERISKVADHRDRYRRRSRSDDRRRRSRTEREERTKGRTSDRKEISNVTYY